MPAERPPRLVAQSELAGCAVVGRFDAPILGGDGNREFLMALAPAVHRPLAEGAPFAAPPASSDHGSGEAALDDGLSPLPRPDRKISAHSRASSFSNDRYT